MQAPVLRSDTGLWKYDCFLDKLYVEILKNAFEPQPCSWTSTNNNKRTGRQLENYCHTHDCLTILGATFCSHSHVFHNQVRQNALNGGDYFFDEQKRNEQKQWSSGSKAQNISSSYMEWQTNFHFENAEMQFHCPLHAFARQMHDNFHFFVQESTSKSILLQLTCVVMSASK